MSAAEEAVAEAGEAHDVASARANPRGLRAPARGAPQPCMGGDDEVASDAAEPMDVAVVHGRGRRCGLDRARLSISGFRRPAPGHEGRGEREDGEQRTAADADRGAQPGSAAACLRAAK